MGTFHEGFYFLHLLFFLLFFGFIPCRGKKEKGDTDKKKEDGNLGALFIPAEVLTGMCVGFLIGNVAGAMFTDLGLEFVFLPYMRFF